MNSEPKPMQSLRSRLVITILICWVVPIVIIVAVAGFLLRSNYDNEMTRRLETDANYTCSSWKPILRGLSPIPRRSAMTA
jgi:hypothetical protein